MFYAKYGKRALDFSISLVALILLSPLLLILTVAGMLAVRGNPFFTQERPGLHENVFKLIKFRTMTNEKDENGEFLPDEVRLIPYGRFLRKTSLDELPELINICKGDMAIVGPRPLLTRYLPFYTERERKRHSVRPGLTGLAQVSGRNALAWDARLSLDVDYAESITLHGDIKILLKTIVKVVKHEDIADAGQFEMLDLDQERKCSRANTEN
ncbi:MAG: sugar transferase [Oscillospiraceae bacterium]|nr:sugar transferase [Oscillospiraceae bacterium]